MLRRLLPWFFRDRETGAITIAQAPDLLLCIVIAAAFARWVRPLTGPLSPALTVVFKGGLLVWAIDEIVRGVNPWRRCLGAAVLAYEFATIL
jgi:hypothetical protein